MINAVGSTAPLRGACNTYGISTGVAASVVVIYRLITYWDRVPLGYGALKYLQRKGEL